MTSKLVPSNPEDCMVIRELVPGSITTLSVPFLRFGKIKFGGRATLVKLQSGTYAVFSPVALTPAVKALLTAPVSHIIAPDLEHHIFLSAWHAAFPDAKVIAPEGLYEKRAAQAKTDKAVTDVPVATTFTKAGKQNIRVGPDFDADFEYEYVDAHVNKELVFFHKPSKTLIQADLLFNLPATEQYSRAGENATTGLFTRLFVGIQNTKGNATWQQRLLWYAISSSDRPSFNKSIGRINSWDFENLIPAHGDTIVGNGKGIFEKVMGRHLDALKHESS